ncbi:MAG: hypothetical protein AMXMBFR13_15800 [Phycisphaerae bacterium]
MWGHRRLQRALSNLGHEIDRSTIAVIPERHGLEPAPERNRKTACREFLARHWDMIVAADFCTVEFWTPGIRAIWEARVDDGCNSTSSAAVFTFDQTGTGITGTFDLCIDVSKQGLRSWQCRG